jgi:hypothetical protein
VRFWHSASRLSLKARRYVPPEQHPHTAGFMDLVFGLSYSRRSWGERSELPDLNFDAVES